MRENTGKKSALVLTLGQQDVQVIYEHDGKCYRAKPNKDVVRQFTKGLLNRLWQYEIMPFGDMICSAAEEIGEIVESHTESDQLSEQNLAIVKNRREIVRFSELNTVHIFFPMVDKALKNFKIHATAHENVKKVVVIYTQRQDGDFYAKKEPFGVFQILRPALASFLGLPEDDVIPVNLLETGDIKAFTNDSLQTVCPESAKRIFETARDLKLKYNVNKVYCSYRSGIPEVTRAVLELMLFWYEYSFVDISSREDDSKIRLINTCPVETVKAGRKIKSLVNKGELEGASILAASFLGEDHPVNLYLNGIQEVLVNGKNLLRKFFADKAIMAFAEKNLIGGSFSATTRAVFRLEHYLTRNDLANALKSTFTFVDILGWEYVNKVFSDDLAKPFINIIENSFFPENATEALAKYRLIEKWPALKRAGAFGYKLKPAGSNAYEDARFPLEIFLEAINNQLYFDLAEVLKPGKSSGSRVAQRARNTAVHGCVNYIDLKNAMHFFSVKGIFLETEESFSIVNSPFLTQLSDSIMGIDLAGAFREFHQLLIEDLNSIVF